MVDLHPAIYDLSTIDKMEHFDFPKPSVFYLHGQYTSFRLINDDKVFQEHYKKLHTFLEKIFTERIWIVVGYSGECDPVFDQIAEIRRFDNNLYWICFKDEDPIPKVNEKLFRDNKGAYYVKKYDADDFFVTLAQKLNCFPPDFIKKPIPFLVRRIQV